MKALLMLGSDAPNRQAELTIEPAGDGVHFYAYYKPGWAGEQLFTTGKTPADAAAQYWSEWEASREESI